MAEYLPLGLVLGRGPCQGKGEPLYYKIPRGAKHDTVDGEKKIEASFQLCFSLRRLESGWRAGYVGKRLPALTEGLQLGS